MLLYIKDSAYTGPHQQKKVGFCAEMHTGKARDRNKLQNHKQDGDSGAEQGGAFQERGAVPVFLHGDQSAGAGKEIANGCTDGRHIDKPSQGFSAEERTGQGDNAICGQTERK